MKRIGFLATFACTALLSQAQEQDPPPPPPPPKIEVVRFDPELAKFHKRNTAVKKVSWATEQTIIIHLKNGKKETYQLSNDTQKKVFNSKYGEAPTPPPPPPVQPKSPSQPS